MVLSVVWAEPASCKPPAGVDVRIFMSKRYGFGNLAPSLARVLSLDSVRDGGSVELPKLDENISLFFIICCGALRTLVSLHVLFYVYLRGETWLLSPKLQSCETLICRSHFPELCEYPELTLEAPNVHACRGMFGGHLHGTCGKVEDPGGDNNEINRICHSCFFKKVETTRNRSRAGKQKATSAGDLKAVDSRGRSVNNGDRSNHAKARAGRSKSRLRLNIVQKRQVLGVLIQMMSQAEISRRFKISGGRDVRNASKDTEANGLAEGNEEDICSGSQLFWALSRGRQHDGNGGGED